jgi:hypothetical protein
MIGINILQWLCIQISNIIGTYFLLELVSTCNYLPNYFVSIECCEICILSSLAEFGHWHWDMLYWG